MITYDLTCHQAAPGSEEERNRELRSGSFSLLADGRVVNGADLSEAEYPAGTDFGTRVARDGSALNPEGKRV